MSMSPGRDPITGDQGAAALPQHAFMLARWIARRVTIETARLLASFAASRARQIISLLRSTSTEVSTNIK